MNALRFTRGELREIATVVSRSFRHVSQKRRVVLDRVLRKLLDHGVSPVDWKDPHRCAVKGCGNLSRYRICSSCYDAGKRA